MNAFSFSKKERFLSQKFPFGGIMTVLLLLAISIMPLAAQGEMGGKKEQMMKKMMKMLKEKAPAKDYVRAHAKEQKPFDLLGGPIRIEISQKSGGVFVALPDNRKLDPRIFGTPEAPRAFEGTPGITGVPLMAREVKDGAYTTMKMKSPFGDKYIVMANGKLSIKAVDATATDAAVTKDQVQLEASWQDKDGNTYTVKCNKVAAHGLEFPTFGGVATNLILHGFTGLGTPLMPSEYTYFAFWGMGSVSKNGEVLDKPRLVHGMLTEYVRGDGYRLDFDKDVSPGRRQFHLMVAPFKPDMENMTYEKSPVKTGFKLPNGMMLPFWHVMFENLEINASRQ